MKLMKIGTAAGLFTVALLAGTSPARADVSIRLSLGDFFCERPAAHRVVMHPVRPVVVHRVVKANPRHRQYARYDRYDRRHDRRYPR